MALFAIRACDCCGSNVWRQNKVDRDDTARVTSFSCLYCGHTLVRVQHLLAKRACQ